MAFLPKHFFKQMDEYIIEKEKDKKNITKLGVGTQRAVEASQKLVSWTPSIGKGDLRNVPRELLGAGIG